MDRITRWKLSNRGHEHYCDPIRPNKHIHDQVGIIPRMQGWFNIYKNNILMYVYTLCTDGRNVM